MQIVLSYHLESLFDALELQLQKKKKTKNYIEIESTWKFESQIVYYKRRSFASSAREPISFDSRNLRFNPQIYHNV